MKALLRDGDFVKVFPIYDQAENLVFLEGHVKRPGSYELKAGMRISDLISSYEVLRAEPYLDHGEIQRLIPPDRRPETISFHLGKLLQGDKDHDLLLQNQDRVIVFAKANLREAPRVNISGEVQSPGWYPLVEKMRVRNLVFQAGNVKRSAYLREAEITRLSKNGLEVTSRRLNINLEEAIRGNPEHNLLLEEDDQLFVRLIPKWFVDRNVVIDGEVRFPGAYAFYKGERLSSVLERAGGFTGGSLPAGGRFYPGIGAQNSGKAHPGIHRGTTAGIAEGGCPACGRGSFQGRNGTAAASPGPEKRARRPSEGGQGYRPDCAQADFSG